MQPPDVSVANHPQQKRAESRDRSQDPVCSTTPALRTASRSARLSPIELASGFSQKMCLPARAAAMPASACQWSGVAMTTPSMSGRASTSRKSAYSAQEVSP